MKSNIHKLFAQRTLKLQTHASLTCIGHRGCNENIDVGFLSFDTPHQYLQVPYAQRSLSQLENDILHVHVLIRRVYHF